MKKLIAVLGLIVMALSAFGLATNLVYLGTGPNTGDGDNLRLAMSKVNTNLAFIDTVSNSIAAAVTNYVTGTSNGLYALIGSGGGGSGIPTIGGTGTNTVLKSLSLANASGAASIQANIYSPSTWSIGQLSYSNGTFASASGPSSAFSFLSTSPLANGQLQISNGAIWMPPATFGGAGNNYGGTIQWGAAGVPTWPYQEGSGSQGKAEIGLFHNWGGGASNSSPVFLVAAQNIRLENGWNTSGIYDTSLSLANEDTSGTINVNYQNSHRWDATRRLGYSYPLNFQCINVDATWGFSFANPGIMAFAQAGNAYLHPQGGHGFLGELWFYTIGPIPDSTGEVTNGIYAGLPVMKMHTNGLEVLGDIYSTNRLSVGGAANQGLVTAGIDFASGLQPAFLVGADNNKTIRTSGTDKVFNMSLAPLTAGNPSHTIISDYNNGGYPTLSIGGGLSSLAPHAEIDFYAATGPITTTGTGNLQLSIVDGAVQFYTRVRMSGTVTAGGTTGAQTINKPSGTVNFAAGATTLVVTDNLVTTDSIISCVVMANDATAIIKNVVPASGSFTIRLNAAATAETKVGFIVVNPN